MRKPTSNNRNDSPSEQLCADLLELIMQRIQRGELVDLEACLKEFPQQVEKLQGLLPAMRLMIDLGHDAAKEDVSPA